MTKAKESPATAPHTPSAAAAAARKATRQEEDDQEARELRLFGLHLAALYAGRVR